MSLSTLINFKLELLGLTEQQQSEIENCRELFTHFISHSTLLLLELRTFRSLGVDEDLVEKFFARV